MLPPVSILGSSAGLKKNQKPFLLIDQAYQELFNAYAWRDRTKKREGIRLTGRLRRVLTAVALGNTVGAVTVYNFTFASFGITEATAEIEPGSLVISIVAPDVATFTDNGNGTFTVTGAGVAAGSFVNYATGNVRIVLSASAGGAAITANINYFPSLPAMGIDQREQANTNFEQTAFFDQKYVYTYDGENFNSPSVTIWAGSDSDFFWCSNYRGINANDRIFFTTNFTPPAANVNNRIRYTSDLVTWTNLTPLVSATDSIFQCRLIIPYYGRLLFFNTYEGLNAGVAVNYFNRCRFSQIGDPLQVDAWRSDIFGKGGFIDAPTSEQIISCRFYKNTLIVFFERSSWILRYVGEYGLPFIWERISSDFGSESTFSTILFDQGVLAVGDKAIISSSANDAQRIDLDIPDQVFEFKNQDNGHKRVHGIRDFDKEVVYWCYPDGTLGNQTGDFVFPNRVLLYNYRNNTWANFRDNVTVFGILQTDKGAISWDSDTPWDSNTSWDGFIQGEFPLIVSGNQQGYIHFYQYPDSEAVTDSLSDLQEEESLSITAVTLSLTNPIRIQVRNHNMQSGEIIYIVGLNFVDSTTKASVSTSLNNKFYYVLNVTTAGSLDPNQLDLFEWNPNTKQYQTTAQTVSLSTPTVGTADYVGGGQLALIPKMNIITKDFNPLQNQGKQVKFVYADFNTDASPSSAITVNLQINSSPTVIGNMLVGNKENETAINQFGNILNITQANPAVVTSINHGILTGEQITIIGVNGMTAINGGTYTITFIDTNSFSLNGIDSTGFGAYTYGGQWEVNETQGKFYLPGSNYAWHRFWATATGQYINLQITYDDELMNTKQIHQSGFELNAMNIYFREGGKTIF